MLKKCQVFFYDFFCHVRLSLGKIIGLKICLQFIRLFQWLQPWIQLSDKHNGLLATRAGFGHSRQ